jgi:hypothetical protein
MVVLVVLVLCNIVLTIYLILLVKDLISENSYAYNYTEIWNRINELTKLIKQIPKEITVKNVLNIP